MKTLFAVLTSIFCLSTAHAEPFSYITCRGKSTDGGFALKAYLKSNSALETVHVLKSNYWFLPSLTSEAHDGNYNLFDLHTQDKVPAGTCELGLPNNIAESVSSTKPSADDIPGYVRCPMATGEQKISVACDTRYFEN
jgi:hypothetical protein